MRYFDLQIISKPHFLKNCHSERSEESCLFKYLRPFAPLRVTKETVWNMQKPQLVFICLGNSCRSIMAEALARHRFGEALAVASAGLSPLGQVAPETLQVLTELGVSTAGLYSKGLKALDFAACRLLVNLSSRSLGAILPAAFQGKLLHRVMIDPYGGDLELYRESREAICRWLVNELEGELSQVLRE
jgi:arsenate reductase